MQAKASVLPEQLLKAAFPGQRFAAANELL
jgi:hypothetical protein